LLLLSPASNAFLLVFEWLLAAFTPLAPFLDPQDTIVKDPFFQAGAHACLPACLPA
jgi:hypothetical protein